MKKLLLLFCASTLFGASFSITISPKLFKAGITKANRLHKFVYIAEGLAAAASLGADGYSTERAIGVPGIHEANPLFVNSGTGSFSQYKFWAYKSGGAALPIVATYILHKVRQDNAVTDVVSIGTAGVLTAGFTWVAVHNIRLTNRIEREQAAAPAF
jgi:hypothetical protein